MAGFFGDNPWVSSKSPLSDRPSSGSGSGAPDDVTAVVSSAPGVAGATAHRHPPGPLVAYDAPWRHSSARV